MEMALNVHYKIKSGFARNVN